MYIIFIGVLIGSLSGFVNAMIREYWPWCGHIHCSAHLEHCRCLRHTTQNNAEEKTKNDVV